MLSKRLRAIADLISPNKSVIDIGTDHAYLPIYLFKNNITKNIVASDISKNVLANTYNNLKKYHLENDIKLVLSDGFTNIFEKYDIGIIAGMGTSTILDILNNKNIPDTLIICSNNDHYLLRKKLYKNGYSIEKEIVIYDNKKYYVIIKFIKKNESITEEELLFGKSNNIEYFKFLKDKYANIYNKTNNIEYKKYCDILNKIIEKNLD